MSSEITPTPVNRATAPFRIGYIEYQTNLPGDPSKLGFTALINGISHPFSMDLDGKVRQLTFSEPKVLNYQPKFSPAGRWIIFGSNRTGTRQLYVMDREGKNVYPVTHVKPGWGAMWPHWQPANRELNHGE